ncbi:hypothetical protein A7K91_12885 [Paenibacillus oryzae]|uniref:Uncharacterized protein n=1 Tax=Paenibacillus oryzae TaxID=1844972 RepID=A0A1A5YG64_9BACL|nr:hypothetical protein A7K91_12885 [Paenibacillus oryzae]
MAVIKANSEDTKVLARLMRAEAASNRIVFLCLKQANVRSFIKIESEDYIYEQLQLQARSQHGGYAKCRNA